MEQLASQMDALRGRELPGFMSAQSFYMFMAQYVEAWRDPARVAATEVGAPSIMALLYSSCMYYNFESSVPPEIRREWRPRRNVGAI